MRREYSKQERLTRACLRVAMVIRGMWEEKGSSDSRLVDSPLIADELVLAGYSVAYKAGLGRGHREHVIPKLVIVKSCHQMLVDKKSDEEIASFIEKHTKIVIVTSDEARSMDRRESGLRQKMPDGWSFAADDEDFYYARLNALNIEWTPAEQVESVVRSHGVEPDETTP